MFTYPQGVTQGLAFAAIPIINAPRSARVEESKNTLLKEYNRIKLKSRVRIQRTAAEVAIVELAEYKIVVE